jgi:uncharacterized protein YuzE
MTEPISVRVDLKIPAAYVKYRVGTSVETRDIIDGGTVAYDLNESGEIIGVEILGIDQSIHVETARQFAHDHRLAFPRDLGGNLVAA